MTEPTMVTSNSIQNRRITESRKLLDIDKAFAFYIHGLKDQNEDLLKLPKHNQWIEADSKGKIILTEDRLNAINEISLPEHPNYYTLTQRWLGTITEITQDGFNAKLEDLNAGGTNEYAEFFSTEVSKDDKPLVSIGAVFYWSLGYANDKGSVKKESIIRFQRLPQWSSEDIDSAVDKARAQSKALKWL